MFVLFELLENFLCKTEIVNEVPSTEWKWRGIVKLSGPFWKEDTAHLYLVSNVKSADSKSDQKKKRDEGGIPLVKSCLQKATRRMKGDVAAKCARFMIKHDLIEFLRRLPIIIVEDSVLDVHFATTVWVMAAFSKGWIPPPACVRFLECITYAHARQPCRDYFQRRRDYPNPLYRSGINEHPFINHIVALMVRASYGGMEGDIYMLASVAELWFSRATNEENVNHWKKDFSNLFHQYVASDLQDTDILLEAADFHCFPDMVDAAKKHVFKVHKKLLTVESARKTIWYFRSGVYEKNYACHPENPIQYMECQRLSSEEVESRRRVEKTWNMLKDWVDEWARKNITFIFEGFDKKKIKIGKDTIQFKPITDFSMVEKLISESTNSSDTEAISPFIPDIAPNEENEIL